MQLLLSPKCSCFHWNMSKCTVSFIACSVSCFHCLLVSDKNKCLFILYVYHTLIQAIDPLINMWLKDYKLVILAHIKDVFTFEALCLMEPVWIQTDGTSVLLMNCVRISFCLFCQSSGLRAPTAFQSSHLISDWITAGTENQQSTNHCSDTSRWLVFISVLVWVKNSRSVFGFFKLRIFLTNKRIRSFLSVGNLEKVIHASICPSSDVCSSLKSRLGYSHWLCLNWTLLFVLMFTAFIAQINIYHPTWATE